MNQSIVYVGVDGTLTGLIYVEDQIREDARHVVESLHKQGVNLYMLSGDKRSTAEYVASKVGIPREKNGYSLLRDPHHNKGIAFSEKERDAHYLRGLHPPVVIAPKSSGGFWLSRCIEKVDVSYFEGPNYIGDREFAKE
ncbi:unnamed protein product [Camellia sinensis]